MKFISPQTQSEYEVVFNADDKFYIAYRKLLETNQYRVRIQCLTEEKIPRLEKVLSNLKYKEKWHEVKGGDHLSVTVKEFPSPFGVMPLIQMDISLSRNLKRMVSVPFRGYVSYSKK